MLFYMNTLVIYDLSVRLYLSYFDLHISSSKMRVVCDISKSGDIPFNSSQIWLVDAGNQNYAFSLGRYKQETFYFPRNQYVVLFLAFFHPCSHHFQSHLIQCCQWGDCYFQYKSMDACCSGQQLCSLFYFTTVLNSHELIGKNLKSWTFCFERCFFLD